MFKVVIRNLILGKKFMNNIDVDKITVMSDELNGVNLDTCSKENVNDIVSGVCDIMMESAFGTYRS